MNVSISYSVQEEPDDDSNEIKRKQIKGERYDGMENEDAMVVGSDRWLRQCFEMKEEQGEDKMCLPDDIHKMKEEYCHLAAKTDKQSTKLSSTLHSKRLSRYEKTRQTWNSELIPSDASVSENADSGLCKYKCDRCCATFPQWSRFSYHMRSKHGSPVKKANIFSFLEKVTIHICKICFQKVLCDSNELSFHFILNHGLKLSEYRRKFEFGSNLSMKAKCDIKLKEGKLSPQIVGNLCIFQCPVCLANFNCLESFYRHSIGDISVRQKCCNLNIARKYLHMYLIEVITHKCKICSKLLFCDAGTIITHISRHHSIGTLTEYANKTGCTVKQHQERLTKYNFEERTRDAVIHEYAGNYCKFTCKMCGLDTKSWRMMKKHLSLKDHWSTKGKVWSNHITKTVLHICLVCNKKILNDNYFLYNHFKTYHFPKVSMTQYLNLQSKQYVKIARLNI